MLQTCYEIYFYTLILTLFLLVPNNRSKSQNKTNMIVQQKN